MICFNTPSEYLKVRTVVNAHKTEYMCFNQISYISTLNGSYLKLVNKFTYQGSSVSSTETDIDTLQAKTWTANDRPSVIWKSDLTDKMKRSFLQTPVMLILLYRCTTWTLTKRIEKKINGNYTRMLRSPHKAAGVRPLTTYHENYQN